MARMPSMGLIVLLALGAATATAQTEKTSSIAVVNFINRNAPDEWDWLEKGFADLLITDLARSDRLTLVERERMQEMLKEMKLGQTGLLDETTAQRVGKALAVEKVLTGSFRVTGETIEIEAHVVDVGTGELVRVETVAGKAGEVLELEKKLALAFLDRLELAPTEAQLAAIKRLATDDLEAARHHYRALDLLDRGWQFDALREVVAARRRDPAFLKASYLCGTLYMALGLERHALVELEGVVGRGQDEALEIRAGIRAIEILLSGHWDNGRGLALCDRLSTLYAGRRTTLGRKEEETVPGSKQEESPARPQGYLVEDVARHLKAAFLRDEGRLEEAMEELAPVRMTVLGQRFNNLAYEYLRRHLEVPRVSEGILYMSPERPEHRAVFAGPGWRRQAADGPSEEYLKEDPGPKERSWGTGVTYLAAAEEGWEFDTIEVSVSTRSKASIYTPWLSQGAWENRSYMTRWHAARPGERLVQLVAEVERGSREPPAWAEIRATIRPAAPLGWLVLSGVQKEHDIQVDGRRYYLETGDFTWVVAAGRHLVVFRKSPSSMGREWLEVEAGKTARFALPPFKADRPWVKLFEDGKFGLFMSATGAGFPDGRFLFVCQMASRLAEVSVKLYGVRRGTDGVWDTFTALPAHINYPGRNAWPELVVDGDEAVLFFISDRTGEEAVYRTRSSDLVQWGPAIRCREFADCVPGITPYGGGFLAAWPDHKNNAVVILESEDLITWKTVARVASSAFGVGNAVLHAQIGVTAEGELLLFVRVIPNGDYYWIALLLFRSGDPGRWSSGLQTYYPNEVHQMRGELFMRSDRIAGLLADTYPAGIVNLSDGGTVVQLMKNEMPQFLRSILPRNFGSLYRVGEGGELLKLQMENISEWTHGVAGNGKECFFLRNDLESGYYMAEKLTDPTGMSRRPYQLVLMDRLYKSKTPQETLAVIGELEKEGSLYARYKAEIAERRASVAREQGDLQGALRYITDWMELQGKSHSPARAAILLEMGDENGAREEIVGAKEEVYANSEEHYTLVGKLLAMGDLDVAVTELKEMVAVDPTEVPAMRLLAVLEYYRGNAEDALAWIERHIHLTPHFEAFLVKALVLHDSDPEGALDMLTEVRKGMGDSPHWTAGVTDMLVKGTELGEPGNGYAGRELMKANCGRLFWLGVKARWDGHLVRAREHLLAAWKGGEMQWWPCIAAKLELDRMKEKP